MITEVPWGKAGHRLIWSTVLRVWTRTVSVTPGFVLLLSCVLNSKSALTFKLVHSLLSIMDCRDSWKHGSLKGRSALGLRLRLSCLGQKPFGCGSEFVISGTQLQNFTLQTHWAVGNFLDLIGQFPRRTYSYVTRH